MLAGNSFGADSSKIQVMIGDELSCNYPKFVIDHFQLQCEGIEGVTVKERVRERERKRERERVRERERHNLHD